MNLQPTALTEYGAAENHEWVASETGTNDAETITLDTTTCLAAYSDGFVKSGTAIGQITTGKKWGPYDNTASDGREVLRGFLFTSQHVKAGQVTVGARMWHGAVYKSKLPKQSGAGSVDTAGITDLAGAFDVRA